jgi:prophage maintenance system killer protein
MATSALLGTAAMVFLEINGIRVEATEKEAVHMMLEVAAKALDVEGIAEFLEQRATSAQPRSKSIQ